VKSRARSVWLRVRESTKAKQAGTSDRGSRSALPFFAEQFGRSAWLAAGEGDVVEGGRMSRKCPALGRAVKLRARRCRWRSVAAMWPSRIM